MKSVKMPPEFRWRRGRRGRRSFTALTWEWSLLEVLKSVIWPKIRNQIEVDAFCFVFRKFGIYRQIIISSLVKPPRNYPLSKFSRWSKIITFSAKRIHCVSRSEYFVWGKHYKANIPIGIFLFCLNWSHQNCSRSSHFS